MGILDRARSAARRSLWFRLLVAIGALISMYGTLLSVFPGRGSGAVFGMIGGLTPLLYRFWGALRLPKKQRVLFCDVLRSGQACAEARVNELVREELARAVSNRVAGGGRRRSDRIARAVITALPVVLAVVAAALRSPWWLLEALVTPLMLMYSAVQPGGDPQQRLERLLATMGPA